MRRRLVIALIALSALGAVAADAPAIRTNAAGLLEVDAAPGTTVRYTLDGSDPDRGSGVWLAPVDLPAGYTLKARAFSPDGNAGRRRRRPAVAACPGARKPSTLVPVTQNRDWRIYDWAEPPRGLRRADEEPAAGDRDARRLDHALLGRRPRRRGRRWTPDRRRGVGSLLRGPPRRESRLRLGPHRERPLAADPRRVRRRQPEGRRRDDRHQQHGPEHHGRDCGGHHGDLRRSSTAGHRPRAFCCSASSRAGRRPTRHERRSTPSTSASRSWTDTMA